MRYSLTAFALLAAACSVPAPVTPPAPTQLTSHLAPSAVIQAAIATLATRGFTVTTSDATNGIMVATHEIPEGTAKDWLACPWKPDAVGWRGTSGQITVTVLAKPAAMGSAVTITGATRSTTRVGNLSADVPGSPACASNGTAEAAVASAISTP